jgi:hypothetical protein
LDPMPDSAREELHTLTTHLLANAPYVIPQPQQLAHEWDKIIISDASAVGWGALCFVPAGGTMMVHAAKWPHPINHSAIAEPRGLRLACRRFLSATSTERVLLVTDHQPIAALGGAKDLPHARGFELNGLFVDLLTYKNASFTYAHVPGTLNPTDPLSRDFVTKHGECWDGDLGHLRLTFFDRGMG